MSSFLSTFKIPTMLGLSVICIGVVAGVYMTIQNQPTSFLTKADPDQSPKNITISNIEDVSVSISWQTSAKVPGFVTFGTDTADGQTLRDDRDSETPVLRTIHHVTLKKLGPQVKYKFKIFSGKTSSSVMDVTTAAVSSSPNVLKPIIGSVLLKDAPLEDGLVYLSVSGAVIQSSVIKNLGNFIIPLSSMRGQDLSQIFSPSLESVGKVTVISKEGQASALVKLNNLHSPIGPLKIGQSLDLTTVVPSPSPSLITSDLVKFDLSPIPGDGFINTADNAVILNNFGKNPKDKRADLNGDGVVDKKDLDLMAQKIAELGNKSIYQ